jgi:hypothetical protein
MHGREKGRPSREEIPSERILDINSQPAEFAHALPHEHDVMPGVLIGKKIANEVHVNGEREQERGQEAEENQFNFALNPQTPPPFQLGEEHYR